MTYADDIHALVVSAQAEATNNYVQGLLDNLESECAAHTADLNEALAQTQATLATTTASLVEAQTARDQALLALDDATDDLIVAGDEIASLNAVIAQLQAHVAQLQQQIDDLLNPEDGDAPYRPVSYASLPAAIAGMGLPTDAQYVIWNHGDQHLEQVHAALPADAVLVLPERYNADGTPKPYLIDSSKGFMAANVASVDGTGPDGLKDGSRWPIVHNSRMWFAMTRGRRGLVGLGPGAVIAPSESSWRMGRQPIKENEPDKDAFYYTTAGQKLSMAGASMKLIELVHQNPIVANLTFRSRSFDGVAYSTVGMAEGSGLKTVKRCFFDGSWRGHAGVPNGETGALSLSRGTYLIENCDFRSVNGTSPIMWNQTQGGTVRHVRSSRPEFGMFTFWRCGGVNVFEDVYTDSRQLGMNIEENQAGFELRWTRGRMTLDFAGNKFHFGINPSGGAPKIHLQDVELSGNAYTENRMTANIYTTSGVAKRSWVTSGGSTLPVSHVPSNRWID